ncbi:MAG: hypothetical protein JO015_08435 [Verrucomicrobia bacterium]|nr:hypothetical protein [Verrucomicrobiota bacterium]
MPIVDEKQLELFKEFVVLQKEELDLKKREQDLRSKELTLEEQNLLNAHEFSQESLKAQLVDRQNERAHRAVLATRAMVFSGAIILSLMVLAGYGMSIGKLNDLREMIVGVLAVAGPSGAALFYARWQEEKKRGEKAEDDK